MGNNNPIQCNTQIIDFDEAYIYIDAFIQNFNDVATNIGLGGYISFADLNENSLSGRLGYYCLEGTNDDMRLFVSSIDGDLNLNDLPVTPPDGTYFAPHTNNIIKKPTFGGPGEYSNLIDFLIKYNVVHSPNSNRLLSKSEMVPLVDSFTSDSSGIFQNGNPPEHICKKPFGIFCLENFDKVKDQGTIIGYRYFFGFDEAEKVNKLRLIIFGVNDQFENVIVYERMGSSIKGVMLEHSYP